MIIKVLAWIFIALNVWSILSAPSKIGKTKKPDDASMVVITFIVGSIAIYLYWHLVK